MNFEIVALELVILLAAFTVLTFGLLFISPLTFITDYPPEIQEEYYRSQNKQAVRKN